MRVSRRFALLGLGSVLLGVRGAQADTRARPRAMLLLRVLGQDRNLGKRAKSDLHVAVVFALDEASKAEAKRMLEALKEASKEAKVRGRDVRVHAFVHDEALERKLKESKVIAAFVCKGPKELQGELSQLTRRLNVLTFSASATAVRKDLSVALLPEGSKSRLVINLKASREEGASLHSALLRIAKVIK